MYKNPGFDRSQVNEVMIDLIDATNDKVFVTMGDSEFVKALRKDVAAVIEQMKK
ncbi:hypothetical protein D3C78_1979040 [compost metagenome]